MVHSKEFKESVKIDYACYICGSILSKAPQVINHVERIHGYSIPRRQVGHNRPLDPDYYFPSEPDAECDLLHYGCPSCWFHCPETGLSELADHVRRQHHPRNVDPSKNQNNRRFDSPESDELTSHDEEDTQQVPQEPEDTFKSIPKEIMDKLTEITELVKNLVVKK